ncbi:hypothetical protein PpBr36_05565 [Pyricularia pennisetigena]|uniref:hypothetical protein n=1 Tax=Pyricularia pennisetigena TaxID=1578925 RepID=UPI00114F0565|nr:hypothetical protein PpBr36_05565 [Pyricularia pennisetigena]TLS27187.1 hypothetical protein PpBr36_05565 [Pyricularia pennisetigena]
MASDDAAAARAEVMKQLDAPGKPDVVLVSHSYGGIVISNAVKGLSVADRKAAGRNNGFNVVYIHAELDKAIVLPVQQVMASAFPAGSYVATLNTSHSPFLSQPKNTADKIHEAVVHFVKKKTA